MNPYDAQTALNAIRHRQERRKTAGPEALFCAAVGVALLGLFSAVAIGAHFLGLPARHTLAAAVTALAAVVASYALRPVAESIVRGNGNG
ncbi:hypothetical protein [Streptomyces goshikiensis]|uniref:hypothetical protein n=1 Tax=Streptomyces goshikiensis TaxID=1942 RepID=UPI0022F3C5BB|nr:hypothetical protein [Streptomyces goshikiensis]WBY24485.1 hypothetical protein PET44_32940 [Streptomyces goshikiensis]